MSNSQLDTQQNEFQYPDEFQYAIAELAGNIPRMARGAEGYKIHMGREHEGSKIQISFALIEGLSSEDEIINKDAIAQFLEFARISELWGVSYHETGELTFSNAGALSNLVDAYIETNPDSLNEDTLLEIEEKFGSVVAEHLSETIVGEQATQSIVQESRYPISAMAFVDGMMAVKGMYSEGEELSLYYMENPDNGVLCMMIACKDMEGEDFCDPDHMDVLAEIEGELSIFADELPVRVKMQDTKNQIIIEADEPMYMLNFIRECYMAKNIIGGEEAYEYYSTQGAAHARYPENVATSIVGNPEEGFGEKNENPHMIKALRRFFNRECVECGDELMEINDPSQMFKLLPMANYSSLDMTHMALAIASESRGSSLSSIEARVLQELGKDVLPKHKAFRIH